MNGYIGVGYTLKKKTPSDFLTGIDLKPHWRRKRGGGGGGGGQGGHVPPHFFDWGGNSMFVPLHF